MMWKNLSIAKKLGVGFGTVLALLLLIGTTTYIEFNKVDRLAGETRKTTQGDQFVLLKTIDHLNWVTRLSDLVFKEDVHTADIETDDHKCGFGQWLYGGDAGKLAKGNEALGNLMEAIKAPHRQLHQSAIKIQERYVAFDPELKALLAERWVDHLSWIKDLSQSMLHGTQFSGGLDPEACAFGQWYHSYQAADSSFAALLKGWEKPHNQLHETAGEIVRRFDQGDLEGARMIYQRKTLPALDLLNAQYGKTMGWIDASVEKNRAVQGIFHQETLPALGKTRELLDQIREQYHQEFEMAENQVLHGIGSAIATTGVLTAAAIAFGILAAVVIARGVTRPIAGGVGFAKTLSEGDLTIKLNLHQQDEVGVLAAALNNMAGNLRTTFQDISGGVETLSAASLELSTISRQMALGAEKTSGKSNQVAVAAKQMSGNMNSMAAASEQASTNVQMVASASEQMSSTINEIAANTETGRIITGDAVIQAKNVSTRVAELGRAAIEVGKVTETINEISEQTNLLALNATIEAARAGEAGKGFAVVANEIKELARQTASATQDIRVKIDGIQGATERTVTEINQIVGMIDKINGIVANTATAVEEQSTSAKEIANSVIQAAQGIQDVNENVAQGSKVSANIAEEVFEVNQAATEMMECSAQVNTSAVELSKLSEGLKRMMEQFKI